MVTQWDLLSIGNLSRNRYWGESDDQGYRSALCTSVLIRGDGFAVVVDPPYADVESMATELNRRTGFALEDIDTVFLTHDHGDHVVGVPHFPHARLVAAQPVAEVLNAAGRLGREVEGVDERLLGCIDLIHTPGHTLSHHSLRFDWKGQSVLVAADAAMTMDFWRDKRGYFNSVDFEAATTSIEKLQTMADLVVPGHGNYFLAEWLK